MVTQYLRNSIITGPTVPGWANNLAEFPSLIMESRVIIRVIQYQYRSNNSMITLYGSGFERCSAPVLLYVPVREVRHAVPVRQCEGQFYFLSE